MARLALLSTRLFFTSLLASTTLVHALRYDASEEKWNLNTNKRAVHPLDYSGDEFPKEFYTPSPDNWRMPFYTLFLDRWVNGDPYNDDINETMYETDHMSNQLRFGGDLTGLVDSLDYIEGLGIKVEPIDRPVLPMTRLLTAAA